MPFSVRDALLKITKALANGAAAVTSGALDLQNSTRGDFVAMAEFLLTAPAMNTTQMPNAKTMTWDIVTSVNSDLSSPTILMPGVVVQTGAGGVGCAAVPYRFRLPTNVQRYVGFRATGSAAGDATTANGILEMLV